MSTSRASDRRWAAGSLAALAFFAWYETDAYRKHDPDATMTYWWRRTLGITPRKRHRFLAVPLVWAFGLWFPVHVTYNKLGIPVKR